MRLGFRGKIAVAIFGVAAAALLLVATLLSFSLSGQTYRRIEQSLVSEARLVADVLATARARHRAGRPSRTKPSGSARRCRRA